jgi:signal transduction protein with GAF and PtsI domain
VGLSALIGLGYRRFSLPAPAHPEIKEIVLAVSAADLTDVARGIDEADGPRDIRRQFGRYLEEILPEGEGLLNRLSVV